MNGSWKDQCSCCGNGIGVNSILCTKCDMWFNKRCSGMKSLAKVRKDFQCPTCKKGKMLKVAKKKNCGN